MVCGVVIAMLLVGLIIILVAVTINKLRKREESASASPASVEAQQTNFGPNSSFSSTGSSQCSSPSPIFATAASLVDGPNGGVGFVHHHHHNNNNNSSSHCNSNSNSSSLGDQQQVTFTRTSGVGVGAGNGVTSNGWVFPPKAPTPNIYNCSNNFDALIAANDKNGFKGFRKQFSGRFKRLVAKKPQEPAPAIPPELKPQLKTIYVY